MTNKLRACVAAALAVSGLIGPHANVGAREQSPASSRHGAVNLENRVIGISEPDIFGPFFVNILYGAETEARKYGIKLIILDAGGYSNIDRQVSDVESLIARHVDAIFVDPADARAFDPVVREAARAKIPVFGFGDPVNGAVSSAYGAHYKIGKAIAAWIGANVKKGDVVAEAGPPGAAWTTARYQGFTETLKQYRGLGLRATQWSDPSRDEGLKLTEDFMTRFPNLKAVYAADNSIGEGAGDAVAAAHAQNRVAVTTAVMSVDTRRMLRTGTIKYVVAMQVVQLGRICVQSAIKVWSGQSVQKDILPPLIGVTKANVDKVDYSTMMAPAGFKP